MDIWENGGSMMVNDGNRDDSGMMVSCTLW